MGVIGVCILPGWMAFCGIDSEGHENPKKLHIYKNIYSQADIFSHPGITVCYFGEDEIYFSPRFFYDNVQDIPSFRLGERLWTGYTCTSLSYPYTMLENHSEDGVLQIMILMENSSEKISLEDPDVRTILQSITIHK